LINMAVGPVFPSCAAMGRGVIRVHEYQAREVSLLRRSSEAIWSAKAAVCAMRTHMDGLAKETRSPGTSNCEFCSSPGARGRPRSWPTFLQASWRGLASLPLSLSSGPPALRCSSLPSADPARAAHTSGRRLVFRVRWKALGFVPDGAQALSRQLRHLSRPCAPSWQGGPYSLAAGIGDHTAGRHGPYPGHGGGQPHGGAVAGWPEGLGTATVPFPPTPEGSGHKTADALSVAWWKGARGDSPAHSCRHRTPHGQTPVQGTESTASPVPQRLRNTAHSSDRPRISQGHTLLSDIPHASPPQPAQDHQLGGIHVSNTSGVVSQQPSRLQSILRATLGYRTHSAATQSDL
jgi:hypothetical protein